jgi:hypothetical protein
MVFGQIGTPGFSGFWKKLLTNYCFFVGEGGELWGKYHIFTPENSKRQSEWPTW